MHAPFTTRRSGLAATLTLGTLAVLTVSAAAPARAQLSPTALVAAAADHVDIGIGLRAAEGSLPAALDLHIHGHDDIPLESDTDPGTDAEYEPGEVLLFVADGGFTRPAGSQFDFIGAAAGSPIFVSPQNRNAGVLYLGLGAEELDPSEGVPAFVGGQVSLSLVSVVGPGQFSLYTTTGGALDTVFMATSDSITGADTVPLGVGTHSHYNFAFTAAGYYALTLRADGTLAGGGTVTDTKTYYFGVGNGFNDPAAAAAALNGSSTSAPEPGSLALLGSAGAGVLGAAIRRRRRRAA